MSQSSAPPSFVDNLHKALQALYDPPELRNNPIIGLLGLEKNTNPAAALRHLLIDSIQALKPDAGVPAHAKSWQVYNVLAYRFVEQIRQKEVAVDLMLSIRTMRRFEKSAVEGLAENLWSQFGLASKVPEEIASLRDDSTDQTGRQGELDRLKETFPVEQVNLVEVIQSTLQTAASLFENSRVQVQFALSDHLPAVSVQLLPLRQALLNLFSLIAQRVPQSTLNIALTVGGPNLALQLVIHSQGSLPWAEVFMPDELEICRNLVQMSGGLFDSAENSAERSWTVNLTLPIAQPFSLLVIDDNADALRLFERYLSGSRFQFFGTQDPDLAIKMAQEVAPNLILLDVMLPGVDGWELLGRLREHPSTRAIPVIVCTFLPQEQLAYTLGASYFLRKPVSRDSLMSALLREVSPPSQALH